ncbi:MAG: diacylglycerol kinase [Azovibrio sp.]|uniref:diacylglycerol kinase n=1 Tax=Azovibrio sp. TaxID=1872673 RepID=UPI003C7804DB
MSTPQPPSAAPFKGKKGLQRLVNALGYSKKGLCAAWHHEAAFREEALLAMVSIPLGLWLGQTGVERALLAGSILLVMIVELLNSAVEAVVDKASPEVHELAGRAKDQGSAAVLFSLLFMAMVWVCVLWR